MSVTKIRAAVRAAMLTVLMSLSAMGVAADVTVTSMTAQQRYAEDGKVAITVTFTGVSNDVANATEEMPDESGAFEASVYVYFPPKGGFSGYSARIRLRWNGTSFVAD